MASWVIRFLPYFYFFQRLHILRAAYSILDRAWQCVCGFSGYRILPPLWVHEIVDSGNKIEFALVRYLINANRQTDGFLTIDFTGLA